MIYSGTQWIFFEQKRSRYLAGQRHNLLQPKVMCVYKVTVYKVIYSIYSMEKEMATHSNTLAGKVPWKEKPGRLQSMGLQRVGHD